MTRFEAACTFIRLSDIARQYRERGLVVPVPIANGINRAARELERWAGEIEKLEA